MYTNLKGVCHMFTKLYLNLNVNFEKKKRILYYIREVKYLENIN